jgi:tetratricopeptide (TPR) repeat protein
MAAALAILALWFQAASPAHAAYERANRLFIAQRYQESFDAVDEALRLDPDLAPALTLKAKLAMAARRYDVARAALERAIAAAPDSAYAHFLYGFHFYEQNQVPAAIEAFEKARRLDPRDPRAALYLGLSRESRGENDAAIALYREAVRLERKSGRPQLETLLICFRLHLLMGKFDAAEPLVAEALKLDAASRDAHFEAARLRMKKGDAAGAVREAETALRASRGDTPDSRIRFLLIQAYRAMGQESDAERHAESLRAEEARPPR